MKVEVLCHSSIRIETNKNIIYIDPFRIEKETSDADVIAITHSHYDHFSEEDILKVKNENTKILITTDLFERTKKLGFKEEDIIMVMPNNLYEILGLIVHTMPAYNINKKFHPKGNNWVGYVFVADNNRIYIAGDTDITEENKKIECDIALIPVGGTYTTTYEEAAKLINIIKPKVAIPTHYGDIVGDKEDGNKFKDKVDKEIKVDIQI